MELLNLVFTVMIITLSGALAPGPLTAATIAIGSSQGFRGGIGVAIGHTLFEFPYVLFLVMAYTKVMEFLSSKPVKIGLSIVAIGILIYFAFLSIKAGIEIMRKGYSAKSVLQKVNPIAIGILFTALNPYFLIWWLSIGFVIVKNIATLSMLGILIVYLAHVWIDYAWLGFVTYIARRGSQISNKFYGSILIIASLIMIYVVVVMFLNTVFAI